MGSNPVHERRRALSGWRGLDTALRIEFHQGEAESDEHDG